MRLQVPKKWLIALTIIQVLVSGMLITCQLYILVALPRSPLIHSNLVNELGFIGVPVASIILAIACTCLIHVRQKCAINMIAFICAFGSIVVATLLHIEWIDLKYDGITIEEDEEDKTLYVALATIILSSPLILLMCYIAIFFNTLNMWFSFEMNSSSPNKGQKSTFLKILFYPFECDNREFLFFYRLEILCHHWHFTCFVWHTNQRWYCVYH